MYIHSLDDYPDDWTTDGRLYPGGSTGGELTGNPDRDWFKVTLNQGIRYRISVTDPGEDHWVSVVLLELNQYYQELIVASRGGANCPPAWSGYSCEPPNSTFIYTPDESRDYYLRVSGNGTGEDYFLSLDILDSPEDPSPPVDPLPPEIPSPPVDPLPPEVPSPPVDPLPPERLRDKVTFEIKNELSIGDIISSVNLIQSNRDYIIDGVDPVPCLAAPGWPCPGIDETKHIEHYVSLEGNNLVLARNLDLAALQDYNLTLWSSSSDLIHSIEVYFDFSDYINVIIEPPVPEPEPTPAPVPTPTPESTYIDNVDEIESIDDITKSDEMLTFELNETSSVGNQEVKTIIIGTIKKDKIIGTSEAEILAGGEGKDILQGGDGADGFLFQDPEGFGKKEADKVKDFDPKEGDSILVDKDIFDLGKKVKLKVVTGKKASKNASNSKKDFIYDDKKGLLYFDENGNEDGWGDGGLFVKLKGAPELAASDFTIV